MEATKYVFYPISAPQIKLYGLLPLGETDGELRRMPKEIAEGVSRNVGSFSAHTSGGRVQFATDAKSICVKAKISGHREAVEVQTVISRCGIDLYACDPFGDLRYLKTLGFRVEFPKPSKKK